MSKQKYKVVYDGHVFTRATDRVYTHVVIGMRSVADSREQAAKSARDQHRLNLDYYTNVVATPVGGQYPKAGYNFPVSQRMKDGAVTFFSQTPEEKVAEELKRFDARIATAKNLTKDGAHSYSVIGWCGRPDLAGKLVAQHAKKAYFVKVFAVPVEEGS